MDPDGRNDMFDAPIHAIMKKKVHSKTERADKMTTLYNLLVYSNADVDATAAYGMTALHMAANVIHSTKSIFNIGWANSCICNAMTCLA